ncbi:hypothetical protein BGX20_007072, partial [Mortierella sp. AD010]
NDELATLKGAAVVRGLVTDIGTPYMTIRLGFRKTNQSDPLKANIYEIHPQSDEPDCCCYTKLSAWLQWLEKHSRTLTDEDLVFPSIDKRGRPKIGEEISQSRVLTLLESFSKAAGLLDGKTNGKYTTHCFRRGGAQHRFMFTKNKWSLKALKWWGGWSERDGSSTIMRYLLEEVTRYETGFGDMLSPVRNDARHTNLMGEQGSQDDEVVTQQTLAMSLETH